MRVQKIITAPNLSSWIIFVWGAVMLNPYSDLFPKNPVLFGSMSTLVNAELFWGALWTSWGLLGLLFAFCNKPHWGAFSTFTAAMSLAALYFVADYAQPGCWFFASIGIANLIIWRSSGRWNLNN